MNKILAETLRTTTRLCCATRIDEGVHAAVAMIGEHRVVSFNYWDEDVDVEAFELEVAAQALHDHSTSIAMAVPMYLRVGDTATDFRPPHGDPLDGETEAIWWLTVDLEDGIDVGVCLLEDAAEPQVVEGRAQLTPATPGWTVVQAFCRVPAL